MAVSSVRRYWISASISSSENRFREAKCVTHSKTLHPTSNEEVSCLANNKRFRKIERPILMIFSVEDNEQFSLIRGIIPQSLISKAHFYLNSNLNKLAVVVWNVNNQKHNNISYKSCGVIGCFDINWASLCRIIGGS